MSTTQPPSVWFTHGTQSLRKPTSQPHTRRTSTTPMQRLTANARKRPSKPTVVLRLGKPSTAHAMRQAERVPPNESTSWGRWTRI